MLHVMRKEYNGVLGYSGQGRCSWMGGPFFIATVQC